MKIRSGIVPKGSYTLHARKYERRGGGLRPMKRWRTAAIASRWVGRGLAGIIRERILFASGQVSNKVVK